MFRAMHANSLLESSSLPALVWGQECSQGEDQWRELYGSQYWCANKYHHTKLCEELFTGGGADYQPYGQTSHLHRSGNCLHLTLRLFYHQGSSGWSPGLQ